MAIFGSAESLGATGTIVEMVVVILAAIIFIKFCGWAKNQTIPSAVKKAIMILTLLGLGVFNYLYMQGNTALAAQQGYNMATIAWAASLAWIFVFAFALMAESKA